ncbi:hypothetical protein GCM10008967_39700 [Bacillus carboniphilus]|uniref:Uncharacterized protein n=1 Tax=Bacillus carboniphilus TaxID=86663 RepID=A0ABN0WS18_9BACI
MPNDVHTNGPDLLSLGNVKRIDPSNGFLIHKYGMNDKRSIKELTYLIQQDAVPNFTLVYLPDNDRPVHNKGPNTLKGLKKLDKQLQNLLNVFPTWEDALSEITWVMIGDSAQSAMVKDKNSALLKLKDLLSDFQIAKIGDIKETNEIVFTPNERMAYIYALQDHIQLTDIKDRLFKDDRMDFVAWKEQDTIHVASPHKAEELTFKKGGPYTDEYQQTWELQGDFSVLDLTVKNDGTIEYGNYPDGLARLYGAINSQEGRFLIAEAKPGHEFKGEGTATHDGGGAHGSIHKKDSVAPILITGTDQLPQHYRIVDLKNWVLQLLLGQGDRNGVPPSNEESKSTPN